MFNGGGWIMLLFHHMRVITSVITNEILNLKSHFSHDFTVFSHVPVLRHCFPQLLWLFTHSHVHRFPHSRCLLCNHPSMSFSVVRLERYFLVQKWLLLSCKPTHCVCFFCFDALFFIYLNILNLIYLPAAMHFLQSWLYFQHCTIVRWTVQELSVPRLEVPTHFLF